MNMQEWYRDGGVMRDEAEAAFEGAAKEESGVEVDDVSSEPAVGSDDDNMACSDDD